MINRKPVHTLIDESMFMPLEVYQSKEVKEKINDQEQHQKTVREMLSQMLKEKIKRKS